MLPYGWADWAKWEKRAGWFICWAEPVPESSSESRYAVVNDNGLIRWCEVSPNPDAPIRLSQGAFYSDMAPGGAVDAAIEGAHAHKAKVRKVLEQFDETRNRG